MEEPKDFEKYLKVLVGLPLSDLGFCGSMAMLSFGTQREITTLLGKRTSAFEQELHVSCGWRFVQANRVILGSDDLHHAAKDEPGFSGRRRCRLLAGDFGEFRVTGAHGRGLFSFSLEFSNGATFEAIPLESTSDPQQELWRLFAPGVDRHIVAKTGGVEVQQGQ